MRSHVHHQEQTLTHGKNKVLLQSRANRRIFSVHHFRAFMYFNTAALKEIVQKQAVTVLYKEVG